MRHRILTAPAAALADLALGPALPPVTAGLAVVTGASSGIGRDVARRLAGRGFTVVGTSRDPGRVSDVPAGVEMAALDLGDPRSVSEFAAAIGARAGTDGPPAVLVNNAGESQFGALEDIPEADVERLFRVNLLAQVEVTRRLLPAMRAAGRGRVVFVGSMLGTIPLSFRSTYGASKAAVHALASSLRGELSPFGVGVSTVEPGAITTGISARRTVYIPASSAYAERARTVLAGLDANEAAGTSTGRIGALVEAAVTDRRPRSYYAAGSGTPGPQLLARLLPEQAVQEAARRRHGLRPDRSHD